MKQFFSFVAALVCAAACNHVNDSNICIIEGNLSGLEGDGWIYMTDMWNDSEIIDSVEYHDGVFRFEVCADEPTKVFLHAGCFSDFTIEFFNDPGKITLSGSVEDARKAQVSGTPMNDAVLEMHRNLDKLMSEPSFVKRTEYCTEYFTKELNDNKGNAYYLSLIRMCESGIHPLVLLDYMESLEPYLKGKAFTSTLKDRLERLTAVSPYMEGSDVKPYYIYMEYPDTEGNPVRLSEVVSKPGNRFVYIDFWATWCGPCRAYMKSLKETYAQYKDKGFEVFAVSCDKDIEAWKKCIEDDGHGWINVRGELYSPEWKAYMVNGLPTTILIDCSTGLIIGRDLIGDMLTTKLEELMH